MFRIHLRAKAPKDYRSSYPTAIEKQALKLFIDNLYDAGIVLIHTGTGTLSTPMTEAEIDRFGEAVFESLRKVRQQLPEWGGVAVPASEGRA